MIFDRKLFFIDEEDREQVEWLKIKLKSNQAYVPRIILVKGNPNKLSIQKN
ncbi:MAG UNVERIFIED_CONTAM: hypothetical protein LVQ98_07765 [Rickettsiaceae bacterium]|jgi:hypothetical protein